jgi:hypothetical protein
MSTDDIAKSSGVQAPAAGSAGLTKSRSDAKKLRKLCSLVRFHAEELMRGTTKLSLNVDVLQVILRLVAGDASEVACDGSDPILFEAACLQDVLKSVLKLKVIVCSSSKSMSVLP